MTRRLSPLARLASPKLAAWLIVVLIIMTVLVVLLPQKGYLGEQFEDFVRDAPVLARLMEAVSFDHVFTGWPIVVLAVLLSANVVTCTFLRLRARRRVPRVAVTRDAAESILPDGVGVTELLDRAERQLRQHRYTVLTRTAEGVVARAGGSGFWGSMLLHVSLLVIIAGGAATVLTSFRGEMAITDGQTVVDSPEYYIAVTNEPEIGDAYTGTRVSVDSTKMRYERGVLVSAVASMRAIEPSGRIVTKEVRVNHPLDAGGKSYLLRDSGYAVALLVGDEDRDEAESLVVRLSERTPRGWRDSLDLGVVDGRPVTLDMLAMPVPVADGERIPAEEFDLSDPRLHATVRSGSRVLWEGTLSQGERVPPEVGVALTFEELRLWDLLLVRGEPARWITYVGFWLAVVGSAWRFAVPERRVSVVVRENGDEKTVAVSLRARPWSGRESASDHALVRSVLGTTEDSVHVGEPTEGGSA